MEMVRRVGDALTAAGITWAVGGSCLLIAHGVWHEPNTDWDLTTDADLGAVQAALQGFGVRLHPETGSGAFATTARLGVEPSIDLMVRFALRTEAGVVHLPTLVSRQWKELPVGSPEVWAVAYRLMGRPVKPDLLTDYLRRHGADPVARATLLAEPLPRGVRDEVEGWPLYPAP